MTAERLICDDYPQALRFLNDGWKLDPFLHQTGRPWTLNDKHVWVFVKGSHEEIEELNPFVMWPPEEPIAVPEELPYVAVLTEKIPFDKATGKLIRAPPHGFVILHKDHITATGTVFTKLPGGMWGQWVPYCPDCEDMVLLTPRGYADAIQGYTCPECSNSYPLGYNFTKPQVEEEVIIA